MIPQTHASSTSSASITRVTFAAESMQLEAVASRTYQEEQRGGGVVRG